MIVTADTIYYLGSTVAQTLASLAGFLGAFVLFYLQGTERSLIEYGARTAGQWTFQLGPAIQTVRAGEFDQFETLMLTNAEQLARDQPGLADAIRQVVTEFKTRRAKRRSAIDRFKWAVGITALALLWSLGLIEAAPAIACRAILAWILTLVLIAGAAACGWLYWRVISACVGRG
jgi:hypothetical protein